MAWEHPRVMFFPTSRKQYFRVWEIPAPNRPTELAHLAAESRMGFKNKATIKATQKKFPSWVWKFCILPTPIWLKAMMQAGLEQEFLVPGPYDGFFWKLVYHGITLSIALGPILIPFNSFIYITFHNKEKVFWFVLLIQSRLGTLFISPQSFLVLGNLLLQLFYKFWR